MQKGSCRENQDKEDMENGILIEYNSGVANRFDRNIIHKGKNMSLGSTCPAKRSMDYRVNQGFHRHTAVWTLLHTLSLPQNRLH